MSGKKAKAARARRSAPPPRRSRRWAFSLGGLVIAAIVTASFLLPDTVGKSKTGAAQGSGLTVGTRVPDFSERLVGSGASISSRTIAGQKTLFFFSEGVMCQACLEQIKGLERLERQLDARAIRLVSVTPDSAAELKQAISLYGLASPMIADDNRDMSRAFNVLGQGMHGDTPGHAFVLVEAGKVRFYRDYWLPPTRTMFVQPERVLADLTK